MVDYRILKKLTPITAEEKEILAGGNKINPKLYMTAGGDAREDVVSSRLMLEKGKLITARTHTRFVDFPEHSHDYIELVYMCSGSTRHIIGGREVQLAEGEELNFFRLSKLFLLAQGREKYLSHSHYAWIDFGYLRYPVYEGATLNWQPLCGKKAVIATVNGVPDPSMFVVPEELLTTLCRELLTVCETALRLGDPLPQEADAWAELIRRRPECIETVECAAPCSLLDKTMMTREEEFHVLA